MRTSFILAAILALTPMIASADAAIFSGSDVKILKSNLDFNGGAKAISQSGDPTSVAVSAPKGSILLNTNTGIGYIKSDAGSSTNWNRLIFGSSAGVLAVASGGTNKSSYTKGDILIASASTTLTALAVSADRTYLMASADSTTGVVWKAFIPPTVQSFTVSGGSGTYTTPAGVKWIRVKLVGGGAGGSGSGTGTSGGISGAGGTTTFGSSLLTATGGSTSINYTAGAGGAGTINSPAVNDGSFDGQFGQGGQTALSGQTLVGGVGGSSLLGLGGPGTVAGPAPGKGYGSGGAGGQVAGPANSGAGGGSGASVVAIIVNPSATYAYATGVLGTAGAAGTSGVAGAAGTQGAIFVTEYYQ